MRPSKGNGSSPGTPTRSMSPEGHRSNLVRSTSKVGEGIGARGEIDRQHKVARRTVAPRGGKMAAPPARANSARVP